MQVSHGAGEDGNVFAGAAYHGVAQVTEQSTNFACLVIMIHDELSLTDTTDGAFAILARVHGFVVFDGHAILCLKISVSDALRVSAIMGATLLQTAQFAHRLNAIQADFVLVKLC